MAEGAGEKMTSRRAENRAGLPLEARKARPYKGSCHAFCTGSGIFNFCANFEQAQDSQPRA